MSRLQILGCLLAVMFGLAAPALAQTDGSHGGRARVDRIIETSTEEIFGTDFTVQILEATILRGPNQGNSIELRNDRQPLSPGARVWFEVTPFAEDTLPQVTQVDRSRALIILVLIFVGAVLWLGRMMGGRSLLALVISFGAIVGILLPGILSGWNPLLASIIVASLILAAAIFLTHGWNRESLVAYAGTMIAVVLAGIFASIAVSITQLTGLAYEESIYLQLGDNANIDITALLLGAFIIGFLGVLDDISVTQTTVVRELFASNPDQSAKDVYHRAMRVGREHVGALVNTLVLAYTAAALPLLLFISQSSYSFGQIVNLEIFATEIVRIIVGSTGLILTVPIVTYLAVRYLKNYDGPKAHGGCAHGHHHH